LLTCEGVDELVEQVLIGVYVSGLVGGGVLVVDVEVVWLRRVVDGAGEHPHLLILVVVEDLFMMVSGRSTGSMVQEGRLLDWHGLVLLEKELVFLAALSVSVLLILVVL
jgi:hypothetical protein